MEGMIAALLIFSLFVGGPAGVESDLNEVDRIKAESSAEPEQFIEEVRLSADEIISTEENVTTATQLLAALPDNDDKHKVAIYEIADKTGQYSEIGSNIVSQGASEMLITALVRSRQFEVLDRVNFSSFMTEQSLVEQDRIVSGQGPKIGRLLGAEYVISGAVTEYQIDKRTGGLGLLVGGKGGIKEYAVASCAVDIRATDTTDGRVIWAKSLKKEIVGEKIGFEVFSFMDNNIVEFESGRGKQEVINLVVRTLLEEAVYKLSISKAL